MATRRHIQHIKSKQASDSDLYGVVKQPKLPTLGTLNEGEIAINYGDGIETISIENAHAEGDPRQNEIVTFSSDKVLYDVEEAVAAVIADMSETVEGTVSSVNGLTETVSGLESDLTELAGVVEDNSLVTSASLNDLNDRKADKTDVYDKSEIDEMMSHVAVDIDVDEELSEESENPVQNKVITRTILDNELVAAAALNDLNDRKLEKIFINGTEIPATNKSANIRIAVNGHEWGPTNDVLNIDCATGFELAGNGQAYPTDEGILRIPAVANTEFGGDASDANGVLTSEQYGLILGRIGTVEDDTLTLANGIYYDSTNKRIYLRNGNTNLSGTYAYIDATDFIKDGMVDNVTIGTPTEGTHARVECLIITFNTDAGKQNIEIPISDIFNASNYYTKTQVDTALAGKFDTDSANVVTSITGVASDDTPPSEHIVNANISMVRRTGKYATADGTTNNQFGYWDTTYGLATADERDGDVIIQGKAGLMPRTDKNKLDGIESGANRYVLPAATTSALGGVIVGTDLNVATDGTLSVDKETVLDNTTGTSTKPVTTKAVYDCIVDLERVLAASENALEDRVSVLESTVVTLNSAIQSLKLYLEGLIGDEEAARIDADDAINDRIDQLHP